MISFHHRLWPARRVRRRLPRRDRPRLPGSTRDRPDPRDPAPGRPFRRAGARLVDRLPARRDGAPGGRRPGSRHGAARDRGAESFGLAVRRTRQRAAGARGGRVRRCRGGRRHRSLAVRARPPCRRRSMGATCSPRSPRRSPPGAGYPRPARRSSPASLVALQRTRASRDADARSSRTSSTSTSSATSSLTRTRTTSPGSPARVRSRSARAPGTVRRSRSAHGVTFADVGTGELVLYEDAHRSAGDRRQPRLGRRTARARRRRRASDRSRGVRIRSDRAVGRTRPGCICAGSIPPTPAPVSWPPPGHRTE